MAETTHLLVDNGPEKGRRIAVPAEGGRLGRSTKNDIVLVDPLLSRHHCRFHFHADGSLWLSDLGSANETLVDGRPAPETRLKRGQRVTVGDTVLVVTDDGTPLPAGAVDLGLAPSAATPARKLPRGPLAVLLLIIVVIALLAWAPKLFKPAPRRDITPPPAVRNLTLDIAYEKVEATPDNIFRYHLTISPDRTITVQIDDIENDRHVRKEKVMERDITDHLAMSLEDAGFFSLAGAYEGIQPGVENSWDLSVTIGRKTHRTYVENRLEPDVFKEARELIEEVGKNELGLWAIQFSAEKLIELATDAYHMARKLHDEREIRYGNLYEAIKCGREAEWYLETVEPKPDFYPELISGVKEAAEELENKYKDHRFQAERAIKLRDWDEALRELQVIRELIPDRSDERYKKAHKSIIEIENRVR